MKGRSGLVVHVVDLTRREALIAPGMLHLKVDGLARVNLCKLPYARPAVWVPDSVSSRPLTQSALNSVSCRCINGALYFRWETGLHVLLLQDARRKVRLFRLLDQHPVRKSSVVRSAQAELTSAPGAHATLPVPNEALLEALASPLHGLLPDHRACDKVCQARLRYDATQAWQAFARSLETSTRARAKGQICSA